MGLNLHGMVRGVIQSVNTDVTALLRRSIGYTTGMNGKQVPSYAADVSGKAQVQALSSTELKHLSDLNIQGIARKVYLYGDWGGPVRADATGGDLLLFPRVKGGPNSTWKIVTTFETWPDWCAVGVVLQ